MKKTGPLLIPLVSWLMPYGNRVENGKKKNGEKIDFAQGRLQGWHEHTRMVHGIYPCSTLLLLLQVAFCSPG